MKKSSNTSSALRHNYLQLLFVFAAFALMVVVAYLFIGNILRSYLFSGAEDLLSSAEANVRVGLSEAETILLNSHYLVQDMVERDVPQQEILDYLTATTEWMRRRDQGLLNYYGIYGYIHGEFYDSIDLNPGDDYIPQRRPWYQWAIRSGNTVAYTTPYRDWRTGDSIISVVRNIDIKGELAGILVVDININHLVEYVGSLKLTTSGYGILLSHNMTLMAHPDRNFWGHQLEELGGAYEEIARNLRSGGEVKGRQVINLNGVSAIVFFRQIFNNWYVGIVTPYTQFYRDLYISALILIVLGLTLSLALCFILLRLSAAKMRADEENKSKSTFLARMSHEIRTPMNAITGMAELLLREDIPDKSRSYVQDIKQAGSNLLSIINDILDFSKIEAGKLEIVPVKYLLSSLVNDTANIIRMRIMEKPVRFFTNVDSAIPNKLIGDEVRLRQIIINLLSNAVNYTEKGHISMSITLENHYTSPETKADPEKKNRFLPAEQIYLKITVTDTGRGIKPADKERLFGDFVQVDTMKNRDIEGTGLGLAITKRFCLAMGGNISVESEYGKGSVFTIIIPQDVDEKVPFAEVEDPEQKKVLVYERRTVYAKSVSWSLENMHIPHTVVTNLDEFGKALFREDWFFVFSSYGLYDKIKPVMERSRSAFLHKKPPLALMVEWGTEAYIPNVWFLYLPVQTLSIANVLNGKEDRNKYPENFKTVGTVQFTFSGARFLVVDDIATNLKVAEGLLAPYRAEVDICLSGPEAIELIKRHDYDIVFMDHMMPEMDGLKVTAAVRALEGERFKTLPIIALTANAVVGMREMFMEKGLNDFLAKPIDIFKLDEILDRWVPKEKREYGLEGDGKGFSPIQPSAPNFHEIPGVDVQKGIAMTGGTIAAYRQVLSTFCKDAEGRLPLFKKFINGNSSGENKNLSAFTTQVHALKSACASLGAAEVSTEAARLENAGKAGNLAFIEENLQGFSEQLAELVENIRTFLNTNAALLHPHVPAPEKIPPKPSGLSIDPVLRDLEAALKAQKADDINRILEEINAQPLDTDIKTKMEQISDEVLMTEYDNAGKILKELLKRRK